MKPKSYRVTVTVDHGPFFIVEGAGAHLNLLWNYGDEVVLSVTDLESLLASVEAGTIVIGRRLDQGEAKKLVSGRVDINAEVFAQLEADPPERWGRRRRR